jgi:hypothetical protein
MIKRIFAITLLLAFAMQMFSKAFIVFDYFANTQSFAKNCVNKAKPKMHCNGKCQMMKKLQQEEKKESQVPERKGENKMEELSTKSFFAIVPSIFSVQISSNYPTIPEMSPIKMPRENFRPPSV